MDRDLITELQARLLTAAEELQKCQEKAIAGQLALEAMHDVRNPLEALGNLIYLALHEAKDPTVARHLNEAEEQVATLRGVIGSSLNFARHLDAPRPVELASVAEAALRVHRQTIETKRIRLVKQLPQNSLATIHAGEILQVVSNFVSNALDSMPADGTLHLRVRKRPGLVQFVIADNGHGVPYEHAAAIFQPFFTTKGENGTGLGLSLSSRIIEQHRGNIRMRSRVTPGKSGTTFVISIPA